MLSTALIFYFLHYALWDMVIIKFCFCKNPQRNIFLDKPKKEKLSEQKEKK